VTKKLPNKRPHKCNTTAAVYWH